MKMMGINELAIWFGWITYSLMIYPVVITIIVLILKAGITIEPFYHNIDAILLWMIFILYCIANMTFLFSIGTLVNKRKSVIPKLTYIPNLKSNKKKTYSTK